MASGRMEFHAYSILQHANFAFTIANDVPMQEVLDKRHYERETYNLILLHGFSGTDTDWIYGGMAQEMSIQFNLNIFMPTTGNSFYIDKGYKGGNWCEFVGSELLKYISDTFNIDVKRDNTLIGGLSMGGYGAIHTALSYPENFCACLGLSSALIIHEYKDRISRSNDEIPIEFIQSVFGDPDIVDKTDMNPEIQYLKLKESGIDIPRIYLACGTEDSLITHNRDFAAFLRDNDADYIFEEGPGIHNWRFWNKYLERGLDRLL